MLAQLAIPRSLVSMRSLSLLVGAGLVLSAAGGCGENGSHPDQGADGSLTPTPDTDAGGSSGGNGDGDGGQTSGETCGSTTCPPGQVCCNESCGICTEPGGGCILIACVDGGPPGGGDADAGSGTGGSQDGDAGNGGGSDRDGGSGEDAGQGVSCGSTTCPPGQVCCNESCGICTEPGGLCTQQQCVGDGGLGFPTPIPGPTPIPDPIGPDGGTVSWDAG